MENLIVGIIIFVIVGIIQFFVKQASKTGGQSSKRESPFSNVFEQIKEEFKEKVNEYAIKDKPQPVFNEKKAKKEIIDSTKTVELKNEEKEEKKVQFNAYSVESNISPVEKINNLPSLQSAVIWKEILDQPMAYRINDYPDD